MQRRGHAEGWQSAVGEANGVEQKRVWSQRRKPHSSFLDYKRRQRGGCRRGRSNPSHLRLCSQQFKVLTCINHLTVLLMDVGMLSSRTGPWSSSDSPKSKDTMRGSRKSSRAWWDQDEGNEEEEEEEISCSLINMRRSGITSQTLWATGTWTPDVSGPRK